MNEATVVSRINPRLVEARYKLRKNVGPGYRLVDLDSGDVIEKNVNLAVWARRVHLDIGEEVGAGQSAAQNLHSGDA